MSQDSTAAAMMALADRKEEAREALEAAIREMGTNPAQVEAAERERVKAERQRDQGYNLLLPFLTDTQKDDALVLAVFQGYGTLAARLLADGTGPDVVGSPALTNLVGVTPLAAAIIGGHDEVFEQLLAGGADREKEFDYGNDRFRPLMVAAFYSDPVCLQRLLAAGAAVNVQCPDGFTALHYVARYGKNSPSDHLCVRLLLDGGADKDAQDAHGRTPLMHAAEKSYLDIVATLLERGADRALEDAVGRTAFEIAEAEGHKELAALLRG